MEKSVQQKCVEVSQTSEDTEKVFMNPSRYFFFFLGLLVVLIFRLNFGSFP